MNRRDFMKTLGVMSIAPSLVAAVEVQPIVDFANCRLYGDVYGPLRFREVQWEWGTKTEISKGPFKTEYHSGGEVDLLDCHGLCANDELVMLLANDLEIGQKNLSKLWRMDIDYNDEDHLKQRVALVESMRRFRLTPREKHQMWSFINDRRGDHDCVHKYYKTRSRFSVA